MSTDPTTEPDPDEPTETGLSEALGVFNRDVLHAAIGVVHEPTADGTALVQSLLQRIEDEARMRCS